MYFLWTRRLISSGLEKHVTGQTELGTVAELFHHIIHLGNSTLLCSPRLLRGTKEKSLKPQFSLNTVERRLYLLNKNLQNIWASDLTKVQLSVSYSKSGMDNWHWQILEQVRIELHLPRGWHVETSVLPTALCFYTITDTQYATIWKILARII